MSAEKRPTQTTLSFPKRARVEPSVANSASMQARRLPKGGAHRAFGGSRTLGGKSGGKRLTVKVLSKQTALPENFEETTWSMLKEAVTAIQELRGTKHSYEQLYKAVESMCIHKLGEKLFQNLEEMVRLHADHVVEALSTHTADMATLLRRVHEAWSEYLTQIVIIRQVFMHLDRTFVKTSTSVASIRDLGVRRFRQSLKAKSELCSKLIDGLCQLISQERRGEAIDKLLASSLTQMLLQLQMYFETFEPRMLEEGEEHYHVLGNDRVSTTTVSSYLNLINRCIEDEEGRVEAYLHPSSLRPLLSGVDKCLLVDHVDEIIERGFIPLIEEKQLSELSRLYGHFRRVRKLPLLQTAFGNYIMKQGEAIVGDKENEKTMVESLLQLRHAMNAVVSDAFKNDADFSHLLKETFEKFMNPEGNKPAQLLAKFIDSKMKSGGKGLNEDEMNALFDQLIELFRSIQGKDVFEAYYKKDLAKRLLLAKSSSTDLEQTMLSKLKTECGHKFTQHLEGMFKDMELSNDMMTKFHEHYPEDTQRVRIKVAVLTSVNWPSYPVLPVKLPPELTKPQEFFKEFYFRHYKKGRKLTWQHSLSQCVLRANFQRGWRDLHVSLYQAMVLLLFNKTTELGYEAIQEATGFDASEMQRTLISLSLGKGKKVLLKSTSGRKIETTDSFKVNHAFKSPHIAIKINTVQLKETKEESEATDKAILSYRQTSVDASIVRTMKTRKTLSHQDLVGQVGSQLRFPVTGKMIKQRIESLIDRDYMERDDDDPNLYKYVAQGWGDETLL